MNSINPSIWGRNAWDFLEHVVFAYPVKPTNIDKQNMKLFFNALGPILPCEKCRINYSDHLKKIPLSDVALSSRNNLINWLVQIHNQVNIMNNKPIVTYNEAIMKYHNKHNNNKYEQTLKVLIITLLFLFVIFFIFLNK